MFAFACPVCRAPVEAASPEELRCPAEGTSYPRVEGIWRLLPPERLAYFRRFMEEYETVRRAEGRGSDGPGYYRALPFQNLAGPFRDDWRIRARSFEALVERVIRPMEVAAPSSEDGTTKTPRNQATPGDPGDSSCLRVLVVPSRLKVLDLGAGNGWLSYRLAQRGHDVAAVDLLVNRFDGLGAHVQYDVDFTPVQAEFDRLPFQAGQADLAVFNGSLHYSTTFAVALAESLRVLRPGGLLAIMDSPIYRDATSGATMVREREETFRRAYGFPSNALPSENYLTYGRLEKLGSALGLRWRLVRPFYGWRWALRPWRARLRGHREPADFLLIVGQRDAGMRGRGENETGCTGCTGCTG